jgi:hypothetical protein
MAALDYASLSGPKRLGDRFLEAGLITRTQLDDALHHQQDAGAERRRLGRTLVELGMVGDADLTAMLSIHFALPEAPFALADAEAHAIRAIPAHVAERHRALPCRVVAGSLYVAVADAIGPDAIEELAVESGLAVVLFLTSETELDAVWAQHYRHGSATLLAARFRDLAARLLALAEACERRARP